MKNTKAGFSRLHFLLIIGLGSFLAILLGSAAYIAGSQRSQAESSGGFGYGYGYGTQIGGSVKVVVSDKKGARVVDGSGATAVVLDTPLVVNSRFSYTSYEVQSVSGNARSRFYRKVDGHHPKWIVFNQAKKLNIETSYHVFGISATGKKVRLTAKPLKTGKQSISSDGALWTVYADGYARVFPLSGSTVEKNWNIHVQFIPEAKNIAVFKRSGAVVAGKIVPNIYRPHELFWRAERPFEKGKYYYVVSGAGKSIKVNFSVR